MASGWVKSLQCKSRAVDDVFNPFPKHHRHHLLLPTSGCRKSSADSIKDVLIDAASKPKHRKPSKKPTKHHEPVFTPSPRVSRSVSVRNPDPMLPVLTELPEGHPSRNVVEIIFHTSWSEKPFSGQVEVIFKVQNGPRTVSRFEEYREAVKARAGLSSGGTTWEENARCAADGNEMMRFHCLGPTGGVLDARGCAWAFPGGKGSAICTFSGSGCAHESAGGGKGRRAMLVCRVISGRVSRQNKLQHDSVLDGLVGFDSVSGEDSELLVFDPRAVLPCFLIIYKL